MFTIFSSSSLRAKEARPTGASSARSQLVLHAHYPLLSAFQCQAQFQAPNEGIRSGRCSEGPGCERQSQKTGQLGAGSGPGVSLDAGLTVHRQGRTVGKAFEHVSLSILT